MIKSTKRTHSKKNAIVALVLVAALTITGAFAFLTARDTAENKFTVGNVDIKLSEPNWQESNGENIVPGQIIAKDPTITNTGTNDAYIYIGLWMPKLDGVKVDGVAQNDYELFSFEENEDWYELDDYRLVDPDQAYNYYLYAYNEPIEPNVSKTLFDNVIVNNISEGLENILPDYSNIVVQGFAIQSDFYNIEAFDPYTAWELYVNQNNWQWPDNPADNFISYYSFQGKLLSRVAYDTTAATYTINQTPSTTDNPIFSGWIGDNGVLYQNGDVTALNKLYVPDKDGTILNPNPRFIEDVSHIDDFEDETDSVRLVPREGSTTVIDRDNMFIYGLEERMTAADYADYLAVEGDGYFEVVANPHGYGTGTEIKLYDNVTKDCLETYYVIIFGDINGDGTVNAIDVSMAEDAYRYTGTENWIENWWSKDSSSYNPAMVKAADLNHDGELNKIDFRVVTSTIDAVALCAAVIDQVTGTVKYY